MGLGFGILLHDIFDTINTNTRQLIDAGTLANVGNSSGLIASGVQPRGNQANRYQTVLIVSKMSCSRMPKPRPIGEPSGSGTSCFCVM